MKRLLSLLMIVSLLVTIVSGCTAKPDAEPPPLPSVTPSSAPVITPIPNPLETRPNGPEFTGLSDPTLLPYVEDTVYQEMVSTIDSEDYFIENVSAVYVSNEYLEELSYNSLRNIYFGYSLTDLDNIFEGDRYIFTLADDGSTTVQRMEILQDHTEDDILRNVAIGTGVILICVTVSAVSGGLGAPAVAMIFASSAKTGAILGLSSGALSGVAVGMLKGYETGDMSEALKAGTLAGSESFKWSAIMGAVAGGAAEGVALKGATLNGLTMNEAARIQRDTKWPLDAIKNIHSFEEAKIYQNAGLTPIKLSNGQLIMGREINWSLKDEFGRTNIARVKAHLAPIDNTGVPYELHHIGQKANSPLAILTQSEHHTPGNFNTLHYQETGKNVLDSEWQKQKREVWNAILEYVGV